MENIDTNKVREEASEKISDFKQSFNEVGDKVKRSAEAIYSDVKASGKEVLETGTETIKDLETYIKDNPFKSVFAAAGAGILIGWWAR